MARLHAGILGRYRCWPRWWRTLGCALFVALTTAACGTTAATPVDVQITLTANSIVSSITTFTVGVPYHFIVTNKDTAGEHEIRIVPPSHPTTLPEELDRLSLVSIAATDLQPGAKKTIDYTFTKAYATGTMELACYLPGHYMGGMRLRIVVK